jgi:hypothetical protein
VLYRRIKRSFCVLAKRQHLSLIVLVTAVLVSAVRAQDAPPQQTVENAQRFLSDALPRRATVQETWRNSQSDPGATHGIRSAYYEVFSLVDQRGRPLDTRCETVVLYSSSPDPERTLTSVKWWDVEEVRQDDTIVIVESAYRTQRFNLPTSALAARVAFAMEFLRGECDPGRDTGF